MAVRAARRALLVASMATAAVLVFAAPAHAGGSWFEVIEDSIQPGDTVTVVGYTGGGAYGWIDDGPFFGWLVPASDDGFGPDPGGLRLPLGQLEVTDTGAGGWMQLRASLTFEVPADLAPGIYAFDYCNEACDERLGDLMGGILQIGVEPDHARARSIPFDDPDFERLADDAAVACPDLQTTAGAVRSGEVTPPDWCFVERTQRADSGVEAATELSPTTSLTTTSTVEAAEVATIDSPEPVSADRAEAAWLGATGLAGLVAVVGLVVGWRVLGRRPVSR